MGCKLNFPDFPESPVYSPPVLVEYIVCDHCSKPGTDSDMHLYSTATLNLCVSVLHTKERLVWIWCVYGVEMRGAVTKQWYLTSRGWERDLKVPLIHFRRNRHCNIASLAVTFKTGKNVIILIICSCWIHADKRRQEQVFSDATFGDSKSCSLRFV